MSPSLLWGPTSDFPKLSPTAQLVYCYIISNRHRLSEGLYVLPKPFIAHEMRQEQQQVDEALQELEKAGYVNYDDTTEMILDRKALIDYKPNPNQVIGAARKVRDLPKSRLRVEFLKLVYSIDGQQDLYDELVKESPDLLTKAFPNASETLSEGSSKDGVRARARQLEEESENEVEVEANGSRSLVPVEDSSVSLLKARLKKARDDGNRTEAARISAELRGMGVAL